MTFVDCSIAYSSVLKYTCMDQAALIDYMLIAANNNNYCIVKSFNERSTEILYLRREDSHAINFWDLTQWEFRRSAYGYEF